MRTSRYVLAALLAVALAAPASTSAAPSDSPTPTLYRLKASKARSIGQKLVRRAVRRSPRLDTAAFRECARTLRGIQCLFIAHGLTADAEFACRFKIEVRRTHGRPSGRIVARTCQKTLRPTLTVERARDAIASVAEPRVGPGGQIQLFRVSRSLFIGYATPSPPEGGEPFCALKLTAELLPDNAILVRTRGTACLAPG